MGAPLDLTTLYGVLRAQILSRHFAVGKYFRADHLSFANHLGVIHAKGSTSGDTQNDPVHGCLWSEAEVTQPKIYNDAASFLTLGDDPPAGNGQRTFERWRIGDHDRINPLMYSGQLMVCLAVESVLGIPGSLAILSRLLATMQSLFKFTNSPYDGYILRWDAVRSDRWETYDVNGETQLDHCCEFLTDSTAPDGYLYCTPLNDPRYVPYMRQSDFNKLSSAQQDKYQQTRKVSVDRLRFWEASMDELTGLLAGYSFAYSVVSDQGIKTQIANQVQRIAKYLSSNAYLLVRPAGGFCVEGASGILPALEFPFGRVFNRIAGSSFSSTTNFEGALKNAGLWSQFSTEFALAAVGGIAAGVALLAALVASGTLSFVAALIPSIVTALGAGVVAKALVLYFDREKFDVRAWPGPANGGDPAVYDQQTDFALAYLFSQVPTKVRFQSWLFGARYFGKYAENFPPFLGLSAINDSDRSVAGAYLGWFNARGGNKAAPDPASFGSGMDDSQADFGNEIDPFATAVAVVLGAGTPTQSKLVSLLNGVATEFATTRKNELPVFWPDGLGGYDLNVQYVTEPVRPALNFMAALALAWYFSKSQSDAGTPLPASIGFPTPPTSGTAFPLATVPQEIVNGTNPEGQGVLVPPDALPSGDVPPGGSDLFSGSAPSPPPSPPPPASFPTTVFAGAMSHSGSITGGNSTDTIQGGQMVSAGCQIIAVQLQLVDKHGNPLSGDNVSTNLIGQPVGVGSWPFAASAQIVSANYQNNPLDETVVVAWQYSTGRAIRYQVVYTLQGGPGTNCSL